MAARAPAASAMDAYTVPDWVEKNSRLFKKPPPKFDHTTGKRGDAILLERDATLVTSLLRSRQEILDAAVGGAELTDDTMNNIDLPPRHQPAEYWRNVENHGNILATFISTARRSSGFTPQLATDKEQAEEYARKFDAWLQEIDSYSPYVHFVGYSQDTKEISSIDRDTILKYISDFVVEVSGATGDLAEALTPRIISLVKSAADLVTQRGTTVHAGFSFETTGTTGAKNPIQSITFASTLLRNTKLGQSTPESTKITLIGYVFQLNSDAIISAADQFANYSIVLGSKQYRDYVNAPLN